MTKKLTKKGALSVTAALDRLADLFVQDAETLGVDPKVAKDFAWRCDLLSDHIDRVAGIDRKALTELDVVQEPGFDPENIGMEKAGPLVGDSDEPYMKGNFGQEEKRELRYDVEQGKLGPDKTVEDQKPLQPGKQAGYDGIGKQATVNQLSRVEGSLHEASLRFAKAGNTKVAKALTRLAKAVMDTQIGVLAGTRTADDVGKVLAAVNTLLPHVAAVNPNSVDTVARMASLAVKVAKKADEPEDEGDESEDEGDEPEDEGEENEPEDEGEEDEKEAKKVKKGGKKSEEDEEPKEAKKGGKKSEDDKPDFLKDKEDEKEAKKGGKKATYGFILDAK